MLYHSTNNNSPTADFEEATIRGLAPDKGLYFPEKIPSIDKKFIENLADYSKEEIAFKVISPYAGDVIPEDVLKSIIAETINFDFPLVQLADGMFALELYHGPTLAFKDVGARFMSRCLSYFVKYGRKKYREKVTVLVATSGDTGGAVANGFFNVDGVDVVILYPSGKVSSVQELQLTTLGKNISALKVDGTFDDCQQLVKRAFADEELNKDLFLTSANSINVARWLPQQFYYFFAYRQWQNKKAPPVISVPSGNFGNICAGLLAHKSGLPVHHFIAACNANDVVQRYLETQEYAAKQTVNTISNAMDVGNPSNFARIIELFEWQFDSIMNVLTAYSISDAETKAVLKNVYTSTGYLMDPHGAVGYLALERYLRQHPEDMGIFLETAHPVKFYDIVEPIIGEKVPMPDSIRAILKDQKRTTLMQPNYQHLKNYLLSR